MRTRSTGWADPLIQVVIVVTVVSISCSARPRGMPWPAVALRVKTFVILQDYRYGTYRNVTTEYCGCRKDAVRLPLVPGTILHALSL